MKKTIILLVSAIIAVASFSSCTKEKAIKFTPSSVTLSVGESKEVITELVGMDGYYNVKYSFDTDYLSVTSSDNGIILTGVAKGSTTVYATLVDYPEVKGTLSVTVN